MELFFYALISGILYGIFFALVGIGLNLIFGVMRMVNLAHGDFIMLGAFGAWLAFSKLNMNPLLAIPIEIFIFIIIGFGVYYAFVPRLSKSRDPEMLSFILFFGIAQIIEALAIFAFGNNQKSIPFSTLGKGSISILSQSIPFSWVVSAAISLIMIGFVYYYLYFTRTGYATRAIMSSPEEASSVGIDVSKISAFAMGIGLSLAAIAGVLAPFMIGSIDPSIGASLTTTSFAIVVIGSLGNPIGTILGGIIYGLAMMFMQTYLASWTNLVPYVILILILLVKPSGLLGKKVRNA
ncbi:branched-chain amino acid ABC transporter permease [Desulfurella sp.]|uniref:branched-chain amino acid ABC transporter permease n=1 Tax=Desulfurella sp. TaxID=1962857 RepID=UPI003D0DE3C2